MPGLVETLRDLVGGVGPYYAINYDVQVWIVWDLRQDPTDRKKTRIPT